MYKNFAMAALMLLLLWSAAATAQTVRKPMGIPNISIKETTAVQALDIPAVSIRSNQSITGIADCECLSGCRNVLPVKLLEFTGRRQTESLVKLNWKTTNEEQNKGFKVERSLGNTNEFAPITFVPAKMQGGYVNEYELFDNNDYTGISYYRLKQLDLDGNYTFSDIVPVKGYGKESSLVLYPNPVRDKLTADIFSPAKTNAVLLLTDVSQKLLYSVNINLNKGINLINIPAAQLGSGVYFIRVITAENKVLPGKFIRL